MFSHTAALYALRTQALALSVCTTPTTAFARASTATYTTSTGALATAAIDVPRVAHYVNGVLQAPVLESAGVNLAPYSERADLWGSQGGCVVTANTTTAPDGTLTGDTLTRQAGATPVAGPSSTFTGNGTKNLSLFIKQGTSPKSFLGAWDDTAGLYRSAVNITWAAGVPSLAAAYSTAPTIGTPEALALYGWYRIAFSIPSVVAANAMFINISPSDDEGMTGADGDTLIVWGLQLEDAATATSYTPNATAGTASRAADVGAADAILAATATGYQRFAGSFLTEGFTVGMEITPAGFAANPVDVVKAVSALTITTRTARAAESATGNRTLSVGLPAYRAWENIDFTPQTGRWFVEEDYLPGPANQFTTGPHGWMELTPQYVLKLYGTPNMGPEALFAASDALLSAFAPRTALTLSTGDVLRVRTDVAPYRSQLLQDSAGFAVVAITVPLRAESLNTI